MSILKYNDITLPYADTVQFQQESMYDEMGGTDWYLTKFDIKVNSIVNQSYIEQLDSQFNGFDPSIRQTAAVVMANIRARLLQPRKQLSFTFNGIEMIPDNVDLPAGHFVDSKNGPRPQSCQIVTLTNSTFLIVYHIIAHYWERNLLDTDTGQTFNERGNPILYNRWTETTTFDNCMFMKRSREGKYIIRSDHPGLQIADSYRGDFAIVGIPPGFLRESSRYMVTADGLGIEFHIVDKQVFKLPPVPAYEARGHYNEYTTINGAKRYGEVTVRLKGAPNISQTLLLQTAISIASAKLAIRGEQLAPGQGFSICDYAGGKEDLYENSVECTIRGMIAIDDATAPERVNFIKNFIGMDDITFLSEPGVDVFRPTYPIRGILGGELGVNAGYLLRAAAYFDPSLRTVVMGQDGQFINPVLPQVGQGDLA